MQPPDALRMALAEVIANERREWRREREVIEAQGRALVAELQAQVQALRGQVETMVAERLATLRDGVDGKDGEPGRDGRDGTDAPAVTDDQITAAVARHFEANPIPAPRDGVNGADGKDGRDGADADPEMVRRMVQDAVAEVVQAFPAPRDGVDGRDGRDGVDGKDGRDGAPGKLSKAVPWEDRVFYDGDVVTHRGAVWQAQRDTGREPGGDDWLCIVAAGRNGEDGRSFVVRGTWQAEEVYQAMDVVALGGSSFVARRDDPGACPGEGWQLIASHGARGKPGEPGPRGVGERGPAGPAVAGFDVDEFGVVTVRNADGTTVALDLYPVLSKIAHR